MLERDIEDYLVKRVKAMGGEVRKVQWIGRNGAPDRLVMLPTAFKRDAGDIMLYESQTIWVELKNPRPSSPSLPTHANVPSTVSTSACASWANASR